MKENGEKIQVRFIKVLSREKHICTNYHLWYMLQGTLCVATGEDHYFLNDGDILLLEPGQRVCGQEDREIFLMDLCIPSGMVFEEIPVYSGKFICNSSVDQQREYVPLQKLMSKIAGAAYDKKPETGVYYKSLSYMLLYYLRTNHFEMKLAADDSEIQKYSDRMNRILVYIQEHFKEDMNLEGLAAYLDLSVAYLSRFFKSAFGMNFVTYVRKFRVEHSLNALLYTDATITNVAIEHGFYTTNAYISAFRQVYQKTPNVYRREHKAQLEAEQAQLGVEMGAKEHKTLTLPTMEDQGYSSLFEDLRIPKARHFVIPVNTDTAPVLPLWKTGINVASARNFMVNDIFNGIQTVQRGIGFMYGRVSFVFTEQLILKQGGSREYYFYYFGQIIRMLLDNKMIPYLDLSYDYRYWGTNANGRIIVDSREFMEDLEALIIYCVQSFGVEEMDRWIFDIGITCVLDDFSCEEPLKFSERFIQGYRLIKKYIPGAKVGGFNIMPAIMEALHGMILKNVLEQGVCPDFLSMNIFPYVVSEELGAETVKRKLLYSNDDAYAVHMVQRMKKSMEGLCQHFDYCPKIYINALGTSIIHRNYINDTCYQATFFVKHTIDLIREVDLICYYQMSDFNFSYTENHLLLNGRNGILSQFGIYKPGYLALQLMAQLSEHVVAKGDGYIVTRGQYDTYHILLCNHVRVSDENCLRISGDSTIREAYTMYDYPDIQNISVTLNGVKDGNYRILSDHLNRENGSLFDEWEKTGFWENPNANELDYLKKAMHTRRNCSQRTTIHGQLNFQMHVAPFEVVLVEAIRMLS